VGRLVLNEENLRKVYNINGFTQGECAELFGYSKRTIADYMKKYSIVGRREKTEKHRKRIAEKLKGNKNGLGTVFSEESRKLISEHSSKTIQEKIAKEGFHWGHTGFKHSEETINNLRDGQIKKLQEKFYKGKMTRLEKKGYKKLTSAGIKFIPQFKIDYYLVDAYIPETKTIVEFQGKYWHTREDIKRKDEAKRTFFANKGYRLIEVWEDQLKDWNPNEVIYNGRY
jgi:very-short-patch-repair endonuclease